MIKHVRIPKQLLVLHEDKLEFMRARMEQVKSSLQLTLTVIKEQG